MNIMYCGDSNTIDGLIISLLSIVKHVRCKLNVYILTMDFKDRMAISDNSIAILEKIVRKGNKRSQVIKIDSLKYYQKCIPTLNIDTRFTPYCMLRLYADLIPEIPDRILYLDYDVVCNNDFTDFYNMDISNYEMVGVLDYYGSHFFKKKIYKKDYINSGVLLLNLGLIRERNLFDKCRIMCRDNKMLLPDQSALNKVLRNKKIVNRKYNEQKKMHKDTIFRHFSTTFKVFPYIKTQTIKPWDVEKLHKVLKIYCFDDIIEEYQKIKEKIYE